MKEGYILKENYFNITQTDVQIADSIMVDISYKNGKRFLTHNIEDVPTCLRNLIVNEDLREFFNLLEPKIPCRDVMLTHDYLNKFEINQYLHFDRWRSLKAMVYLTDVGEGDGAFSVVPGSHKRGAELRRSYRNLPYGIRPNRVVSDFPEDYKKPVKILGPAGTLILFDSDIFHSGGDIYEGRERKLIRSHWYYNRKWQEEV
jgi:hypothetical protein